MSFKLNTKTSLSKGKAKSLAKYTNASQVHQLSAVQPVTKDTGEDTNQNANGVTLAKELSSSLEATSTSQKELVPIHQESLTSITNHEVTPNAKLNPETGVKRKLEEEEEQRAKKVRKMKKMKSLIIYTNLRTK